MCRVQNSNHWCPQDMAGASGMCEPCLWLLTHMHSHLGGRFRSSGQLRKSYSNLERAKPCNQVDLWPTELSFLLEVGVHDHGVLLPEKDLSSCCWLSHTGLRTQFYPPVGLTTRTLKPREMDEKGTARVSVGRPCGDLMPAAVSLQHFMPFMLFGPFSRHLGKIEAE